jgi:hypothetical protein
MYSNRRSSSGFLKPYHLQSAGLLLVVIELMVRIASTFADVVLELLCLLLVEVGVSDAEVITLPLDGVDQGLVGC